MFPQLLSFPLSLLLLLFAISPLNGELVINVVPEGRNSHSCLEGKTNCSSLQYVLNQLTNESAACQPVIDVTINVHGDQTLDSISDSGFVFHEAMNIVINGCPSDYEETVTVTCSSVGAGLYFNNSANITISHMTWVNCGAWHPTTANAITWTNCTSDDDDCHKLVLPKAISAIFAFNCIDITLDHTHFTSDIGSGVSLYNVGGVVNIKDCSFYNHSLNSANVCRSLNETTPTCSPQSTGLYIEFTYCPEISRYCNIDNTSMIGAEYRIHRCRFHGNNNEGAYRDITDIPTPMEVNETVHWPFGRGGGMGVVLKVFLLKYFNITLTDSIFYDNTAVYGGGLYMILQSGYPDHNYFTLKGNSFHGNEAYYNGGGACIEIDVLYNTDVTCDVLKHWLRNHLYVGWTNFTQNIAYWGGGVAFTAYPLNATYMDFKMVACQFNDNQFSGAGGALALLRKEKPEQKLFYIAKAELYGCVFKGHKPVYVSTGSEQFIPSAVHSEGIELSFHSVTEFSNNYATALRLSDTGALLDDEVIFHHNIGFNGGGVALYGKSWITVSYKAKVNFNQNLAHQYGGAIYYDPAPVLNMNMTGSCFVWYKAPPGTVDVPVEKWWANVSFEGNHASQCGDAAYVSDPQQCVWPGQLSLFDPQRAEIFDYSGQKIVERMICTPTKNLSFTIPEKSKSNYIPAKRDSDYAKYRLMPGESLQLTLITTDSLQQEVTPTVISVICYSYDNYNSYNESTDACSNTSDYNIEAFNRQVLSGSVLKNFRVYGPNVDDLKSNNETDTPNTDTNLILVFKTNDPIPLVLPLMIEFTRCDNGYQYDRQKKSCSCLHNSNDDDSPAVVCSSAVSMYDIGTPCIKRGYWYGKMKGDKGNVSVYHFCHNDRCIGHHHDNACDNYEGYIKVPSSESGLCINGLQGPLCTECSAGRFLSYNSYKCINCTGSDVVGLILLILLGCFLVVVLIVGFVKLNVRVPTASFYSFLYFYSVVNLLLLIQIPTGLDGVISVIVGVASLDFQILQYMDMCFRHFSSIHYEVIHYVYPIAIGAMIFLIIKLDQSGWRRYQFFSGETATQALCIILLITYTSISETSLNILLPLSYQTPNGTKDSFNHWYVYIDPGVHYLDRKKHLPFWLIALAVELFLVLPFSLLLFLGPWLVKYINLIKIKPILDEYHNCFHDNCRWFAGIYLLARQAMFMITALADHPSLMAYLQQTFSLMLLILVATLQPYRQKLLNMIDICLLSLLTFLSFTANNYRAYRQETSLQLTVVGVACILPCVLLMGVVSFYKFQSIMKKTTLVARFRRRLKMQSFIESDIPDDESNVSSLDKTRNSSRADTSRIMTDDLPPRFYEEEQHTRRSDESAPLLQTAVVYPRGKPNYSINNQRAATN